MKKQTKAPVKKVVAKKIPAKKKVVKKVAPKIKKKTKGRDKTTGRFLSGNEVAVKWTIQTMMPELEKVMSVLTEDSSGDQFDNPVRANDIKYANEAVLVAKRKLGCRIDLRTWWYWNEKKFKDTIPEDSPVLVIIKEINTICELRYLYSGNMIDLFALKNHYGYRDKTETDITTGGEKINETKTKIDLSGIPVNVLKMLREKVAAK